MIKIITAAVGLIFISNAFAQTIPPLPSAISPNANDSETFICNVSSINEDFFNRATNLWTSAAVGGKFQALSPILLRVRSQTSATAEAEVFNFYKKYAAAAYIKSPMYDKGTRLTQKYVVSKCQVDSSRATNVNLKNVPLDSYKRLLSANDHIINFLAINKTPISNEQIAKLVSGGAFSTDAFERQDQIEKAATSAKNAMKKPAVRFIVLDGLMQLGEYDFAKKSFDLSRLKLSAEQYSYQAPRFNEPNVPSYSLTVPAQFLTYSPISTEEARQIERARNKTPSMKLKTYIQIEDASFTSGPVVKATVAAIEVTTENGDLILKKSVK
jgi:hypothetical protein